MAISGGSTVVTKLLLHVNRGDAKLLFSAANDGTIVAWGSGGAVHDRIPVSYHVSKYSSCLSFSCLTK